jgi:hypothetical protein
MNHSMLRRLSGVHPAQKKRTIVRCATLQNPEEVEVATRGCSTEQREKLLGQWVLAGIVSAQLFADLRGNMPNNLVANLTVLTTPARASYAVICCQKGFRQHRFVLPLFEQKVMAFIEAISTQPLNLYLANVKGGEEAFLFDCDLLASEVSPVIDCFRAVDQGSRDDFIAELPTFLADVAHPLFVERQCGADVVREVDVSMLMPTRSDATST